MPAIFIPSIICTPASSRLTFLPFQRPSARASTRQVALQLAKPAAPTNLGNGHGLNSWRKQEANRHKPSPRTNQWGWFTIQMVGVSLVYHIDSFNVVWIILRTRSLHGTAHSPILRVGIVLPNCSQSVHGGDVITFQCRSAQNPLLSVVLPSIDQLIGSPHTYICYDSNKNKNNNSENSSNDQHHNYNI